jgi:hypothetical protein
MGYRPVGVAQQRSGALKAAGEQIGVWRLPESATKLAAEVGARKTCRAREIIDVQGLEVTGVGKILGAQ